MEYQAGQLGRVIVIRGFDGEDVYAGIEGIAAREGIQSAAVLVVGGLRSAKVVAGPRDPNGPIEPLFEQFDDAREIAGVGTIFHDGTGPKLHLHGAIGRAGQKTIAGCPRGGATVFAVLEVVIIEITGIAATRTLDPSLGLKLLRLAGGKTL
jgi:predicted DNA-binding protein with PD1-like motif